MYILNTVYLLSKFVDEKVRFKHFTVGYCSTTNYELSQLRLPIIFDYCDFDLYYDFLITIKYTLFVNNCSLGCQNCRHFFAVKIRIITIRPSTFKFNKTNYVICQFVSCKLNILLLRLLFFLVRFNQGRQN